MKIIQCGLVGMLALSAFSCGGDDDNDASQTIRLTVDSASVALTAGETKTVAVTIIATLFRAGCG